MKKYLLSLLLLCNVSYAQVVGVPPTPGVPYTQSSNLLNPTVSSWAGTVQGQNGGFAGGNTPAFNPGTNTIIFGYVLAPATQTIAINQALAAVGSGIKIGGYSYSWNVNNDPISGQYGTLSSSVTLRDSSGTTLQNYRSSYPQMPGAGFITYSGTQWFPQDYPLSNLSTIEVNFTGKDATFWAGYYGPQVRNPSLSLQYTPDLCVSNPLSDPTCPGYAAAYLTQQCSINSLFDPSCPGYTIAQCNINPLFSPVCPGYQAAYLAQQCSLNPLYDPICPGYASASLAQQCSNNPLSDASCPGYAAAYLTQQCQSNPLYDKSCPGYAAAYAKQNLLSSSTTTTNKTTTTVSKTEPTVSVSSDGKVETTVSKTGDSSVDSVIETKATSASPSDATATVQLTPSGGQNVGTQTFTQTQQTKTETKTTSSNNNEQQNVRTTRTERSEQKSGTNESKSNTEVKQASNEKAKQEMKKAETAKTFESQVAVQQNVISAMSFVPGFSTYAQSNVPDILQKQLQKQYGKDVIDNRAGRRMFGGSDKLHEEMIGQQYR